MTVVHPHDDIRIYHKEAKSLAKSGYQVTIINPEHSGTDELGICFQKIDVPTERRRRMLTSWKTALSAAFKTDAVIYHIHDPELLPAAMVLKWRGKHVVYDAHEDTPRQIINKAWIPVSYRKFISELFEKYENYCAKRLDVIIAATQTIADRFGNSVVVHNYPHHGDFSKIGETTPYLRRKNNICYIGSITNQRGILQTLTAIETLDVTYYLAGNYETLELKNEIEKMPAFVKTEYKGFLNRQETSQLLSQSRIGMLTLQPLLSYQDSLPIKLFEYMLAGLPVIASDFPLWKQLFGTTAILYVDPTNPIEITEAIDFLLKNPDRAKSMGEAGRELVLKSFTYAIEERKLLKCYAKILSE